MTAPGASSTTAANTISGGTVSGPVVQARTVSGGIHHHLAPEPAPVMARQLPRVAPYFTGRAAEQAALDAARATGVSTVVLSGIAGVGKSALAAQWLHAQAASADAQLYTDLAHTVGPLPETVLQQWLRALGVDRAPAEQSEAVGLWRSLTADRAVHLLVDGAVDAGQVRPLLPTGPRSLTVITSRRLLWELTVDGALALPVTPLSPQDATRLLCAAAGHPQAHDGGVRVPVAEALAEACERLPLPLVVTGARLRTRPGRPFTTLARTRTCTSSTDPRENARMAIATALDDSYAALPPDAQRLYRTLGVLPARTVDTDLTAAVCEMPPADAEWFLEVVADERLLDPAPGDSSEPRYRMNDAVRDHARAKALAADTTEQREAGLRRLCDWLLEWSRRAQRLVTPAQATLLNPGPSVADGPFEDGAAALAWMEMQQDSLLPVLEAAEAAGWDELVFALVDAWWPLFLNRHPYALWITAHRIGVAAARRAGNAPVVRQMLSSGAIGLVAARQFEEAGHWYEQVVESARAAGDVRDEGQALLGLGGCVLEAGHPGRAREYLEAARSRWEACEYPRGVGLVEITRGQVCLAEGDPAAAKGHLASAHVRLTGLDETFEAARALALHGQARARCGETAEAIAELERALDAVASSILWKARTLKWLGQAHHLDGDEETARTCWATAADLYAAIRPADAERLRARAAGQ